MARVYLAYEKKLEREVALKVLLRSLTEEEEITKRFLKEAKTAGRLRHSNIVAIYDVGQTSGTYYFAMERLGDNLKERIGHKGQTPLPPVESLRITKQLAGALAYAHNEGFIHRDIKPENILFRKDGTPVLVDFGIARAIDSETKTSKTWMSLGTPYYMSPEQINGEDLDNRTDIYSLGVVLYEMLTGEVPYDGANFISISMKHLQEPVPKLPQSINRYQPMIDKMMAKNRADRVQNGLEITTLIDRFLQVSETEKEYTIPREEAAGSKQQSNKGPLFAAAALLVILAISLYFLIRGPLAKKVTFPPAVEKQAPIVTKQDERKTMPTVDAAAVKAPDLDFSKLIRVRMPICIRKVEPVYPQAAIEAHVEGKVIVDAVTDSEGNVRNTVVVSGNPLLTEAAVEAIKQWRYKPYMVNEKPIPVVFSVTLDFRLDKSDTGSISETPKEE
ncbi:MAG: TonB family protein [Candidatus Aminicenantes bacterium]|nr:TonB family protein [Candidatus Aminicenantes bacterium]